MLLPPLSIPQRADLQKGARTEEMGHSDKTLCLGRVHGQKVNVNIVVKDVGTDGKEELKADVVPVTLAAEKLDEVSHTKPGI